MAVSPIKKPPVPLSEPAKAAKHVEPAAHPLLREAKATAAPKVQEAKPLPVVNTQGQTTGRLLNVSA